MEEVNWNDIADLIERWSKRVPDDLALNMSWVEEAKKGLDDKEFGTNKSDTMRLGLLLHPTLINYLEEFYPTLFSDNKNVKTFAEKFKKFAIPEKY